MNQRLTGLATTFTIDEVKAMRILFNKLLTGARDVSVIARNPAIRTTAGKFVRLGKKVDTFEASIKRLEGSCE